MALLNKCKRFNTDDLLRIMKRINGIKYNNKESSNVVKIRAVKKGINNLKGNALCIIWDIFISWVNNLSPKYVVNKAKSKYVIIVVRIEKENDT